MSSQTATLAIVFADISGSTQLFERYGNAEAKRIVSHTLSLMTNVTNEYGGSVLRTIGDEVMCAFSDLEGALAAVAHMLPAVKADPSLSAYGVSIRVGMHVGEVLLEDGEVYGDAVNVAARMASLAKADQFITSQSTLERLPLWTNTLARPLGPVKVRGKRQAIDVVEVLWQTNRRELTDLSEHLREPPVSVHSLLVLRYGGRAYEVTADQLPFQLGRGTKNDLVVGHKAASRHHASIDEDKGMFMLSDHSSNGTFLRMGSTDEIFLHRNHIHLQKKGVICLGQKIAEDEAAVIHFTCAR